MSISSDGVPLNGTIPTMLIQPTPCIVAVSTAQLISWAGVTSSIKDDDSFDTLKSTFLTMQITLKPTLIGEIGRLNKIDNARAKRGHRKVVPLRY